MGSAPRRLFQALAASACLSSGPVQAADAANSEFVAVPQVTVEMEKSFLSKYQAAVKKQDIDAYLALVAAGSSPDAGSNLKSNPNMKDLLEFSMTMEGSPGVSYSFTPVEPGEHNKPTQVDSKTYDDNLSAVVALTVTFPSPAHPSADEGMLKSARHLLGIQNHQLVMVGSKEDDHAVIPPPPAPMPAPPNYGLKPNVRHLTDSQKEAVDNGMSFASMNAFMTSIKQPSLEPLASGKTGLEYCAIYRLKPNLLVCASISRGGESNFGFQFRARDAKGADLVCEPRWIDLVDVATDGAPAPDVMAYVFDVPPDYLGPIAVKLQEQDNTGKDAGSYSHTVDWK